ncbi:MAG: class B sortase [Clostridia bacterium]|nr:class B sortase [Clostridia bacterium]
MTRVKKIILVLLIIIFAFVFAYSGFVLLREYTMRERDSKTFDDLADLVMLPEVSEEPSNDISSSESNSDKTDLNNEPNDVSNAEPVVVHKRNLEPIISKNSDCLGWIYVEDSAVDYPVMHTPNEPEKYINLSFDWKYSAYGVPFMDYRCTENCDNIVIYGHNMKDGSMFATVVQYMDEDFFFSHPKIEFETVDGCKTYSVFAIVSLKANDSWYSYHDFKDETAFDENIKRMRAKSLYKNDVKVEFGKKIITLSTCYGASYDDRLVLLAVEE